MSIPALVGLPGHGKSYSVVELFLLPALEEGRTIVTNVPLTDLVKEKYPDANIIACDLSELAKPENAQQWREMPKSAVFLLDELWRIWPSGLKAKDIPVEQLSFIKEHRHNIDESGREPDIVLVTQDLSDIAPAIRNMVEVTIICTKMLAVGSKNRFRRDYYQGAQKGFKGPDVAFIKQEHSVYKKEIHQFYKSHTKSSGVASSIDNKGVVNATIFNGLGFKVGVGFLVFLLVVVYFSFSRAKSGVEKMRASPVPKVTEPMPPPKKHQVFSKPAPVPVTVTKPVQFPESKTWRLAGYHVVNGDMVVHITDGQRYRRLAFKKYCGMVPDRTREITCKVNGELVASYTGNLAYRGFLPESVNDVNPIR